MTGLNENKDLSLGSTSNNFKVLIEHLITKKHYKALCSVKHFVKVTRKETF